MGTHIIEYIGRNKLVHTKFDHWRMKKPRPGDWVDFGDQTGEYPFTHGKYGRIASLNVADTGMYSVCCEPGSCFLGEDYVSISGGPFITIHPDQLVMTTALHSGTYWNWGNNSPGGGQGVHYTLTRPVFRLVSHNEADKERVREAFES